MTKRATQARLIEAVKPGDVLDWLSVLLVVGLYFATKLVEWVLQLRHWHFFGRFDYLMLTVLAILSATIVWHTRRRVEKLLATSEQRRRRAEQLAAENAAVARVAGTVAREFAQPLSGVITYSEMLMARIDDFQRDEQRQIEGLREGALQLERLLVTLRQAVDAPPPEVGMRHVADDVERSVMAPRERIAVRPLR